MFDSSASADEVNKNLQSSFEHLLNLIRPCKAEQPLGCMKLQEKEAQKD